MDHLSHETFLKAIDGKLRVRLRFFSKEDGAVLERTCAPMDFGPSRRAKDGLERYHLWDFDSDTRAHVLSLLPDQIATVEALDQSFEPSEFITWSTATSPWFYRRDWGEHS